MDENFLRDSFTTDGTVVDIMEQLQKTSNSAHLVLRPVIDYKLDKIYRFTAEVDARRYRIKTGDSLQILVSRDNHKVAKLKQGRKESTLLLNIFLLLGIIACLLSAHLFQPSELSIKWLQDPFSLALVGGALIFAYIKVYPALQILLSHGLKHSENAREVEESL
ncbi:hypothetical protein [Candidatus Pelagadaptatus aseana]|uniref:hypothetical protein n=1 Tax=Candidatus Pelagadaptatus aseana TaxID=3120508 RepID=UPI003C70270A